MIFSCVPLANILKTYIWFQRTIHELFEVICINNPFEFKMIIYIVFNKVVHVEILYIKSKKCAKMMLFVNTSSFIIYSENRTFLYNTFNCCLNKCISFLSLSVMHIVVVYVTFYDVYSSCLVMCVALVVFSNCVGNTNYLHSLVIGQGKASF